MNLKDETIEALEKSGKIKDDIMWIGTREFKFEIDNFWELSNIEYSEYFGPNVAIDLIICGQDWWLSRSKDSDSEFWVFNTYPKQSKETKSIVWLDRDKSYEIFGEYYWSNVLELYKKGLINTDSLYLNLEYWFYSVFEDEENIGELKREFYLNQKEFFRKWNNFMEYK